MRDKEDVRIEIQERKKYRIFCWRMSIVLITISLVLSTINSYRFLVVLVLGVFVYFYSFSYTVEIERLEGEVLEGEETRSQHVIEEERKKQKR
jgi:hypothetical protein